MSFFRGNETVVIKRRSAATTDEYGNKTYSLTTITVKECFLGFGSTNEPVDANRDPEDQSLTVYFPNGTQVQPGDRFVIRGLEFVKDGTAQDWGTNNPFGLEAGVIVQVRRRNG